MVNRKRAPRALPVVAVVGVVLAVIAVSCIHRSDQPGRSTDRPARAVSTASTPQPPAPGSASPPSTVTQDAAPDSPDADGLLPFTGRQITAAADLTKRFTAAYASHRFDETPQTYLDRLAPMISTQLQPIIAQAATDPATLEQRRQRREVTTAQAHAEAIRTLGPTSITVLLTATTQTAQQQAGQQQAVRRETTRYAVTVMPRDRGWRVYAIELAATGDTGEESGSGDEANRP